jgi:uncharacterized protein
VTTLTRNRTTRLLVLAILLSVAGCFSLGRQAPAQKHYVLGAGGGAEQAAPAAARPAAEPGGLVVGLRPLRLADYLSTPFIVVRRGEHEVEFSEFHRWGEDLSRAVNRTVARRLASRIPEGRIEVAPWPVGTSPEFVIQVHLLRFEGLARVGAEDAGEAHLLATWEVLRPGDGGVLARGTTDVREGGWSVGDFDGLVRLLDAGLEVLARDLVLGLGRALAPGSGSLPSPLAPSVVPPSNDRGDRPRPSG